MQDQSVTTSNLSPVLHQQDEAQMIGELRDLNKEQLTERLLNFSSPELTRIAHNAFNQFGRSLRANLREEQLESFIQVLDPCMQILIERVPVRSLVRPAPIYNDAGFIAYSLTTLMGAVLSFQRFPAKVKALRLLVKLHTPNWPSNPLTPFDLQATRHFYSTVFGSAMAGPTDLPQLTPQAFLNTLFSMFYNSQLTYRDRYLICLLIPQIDKSCLAQCLKNRGGLQTIVDLLLKVLDDFKAALNSSPPPDSSILQRAFLGLFTHNRAQHVEAAEAASSHLPNTYSRLLLLLLSIVENDPTASQCPGLQASCLLLFERATRLQYQLKGEAAQDLRSPPFKVFATLTLRLMAIVFRSRTTALPLAPIVNYTLFLVGFLATPEGYTWLSSSTPHPIYGGRCEYLLALTYHMQFLRTALVASPGASPQLLLLSFEASLILCQFLVGYTPVLSPAIQALSNDFYTIFWEFYSGLPTEPLETSPPFVDKPAAKLLMPLYGVIQASLGENRPNSLMTVRLHLVPTNMQTFMNNFFVLPTLSILLVRHQELLTSPDSGGLQFVAKLFKNFSLDKAGLEDFCFNFPVLFEQAARTFRDIVSSFCSPRGKYSPLFRAGLDSHRSQILSYVCIPLRRIATMPRLVSYVDTLNLPGLLSELLLCDSPPSNPTIFAMTSIFHLFDDLFKNSTVRTAYSTPTGACHFTSLLGHAFLYYAGNPRALPIVPRDEPPDQTLERLALYSKYGRQVLEGLFNLMKRCETDSAWQQKLVACTPPEPPSLNVAPAATVHFRRLISVPGNHLAPSTVPPSEPVVSVVPLLFKVMACWSHNSELSSSAALRLLALIRVPACARYIVNLTSHIGSLSYELTRTYFKDAKLNQIFTCLLSKLLTDQQNLRILLLRDRFGEWYRNILRFPDYANHSKLTEPTKLTMPIVREIYKNLDSTMAIFNDCREASPSGRLHEYTAVGLSYFSLPECTHAQFTGLTGNPAAYFANTDWLASPAPFGVLVRMLFGTLDFGEGSSSARLDSMRNRAAAYAINYHAFFKTTPLRRKMKWAMKDSFTLQSSILAPIIQNYLQEAARGRGDDTVSFIPDDPDMAAGEVVVPRGLVTSMSPIWADMLEAGGQETLEQRIILPYNCYTSLAYLVLRMRTLMERRTSRASRLEGVAGDLARVRQPAKLKGLLELADRYQIEFLRQYCVGGVVRLLFTAARAPRPAQALHTVYTLFAEGDQFPLFHASPDLSRFMCHLIALHLPDFLVAPSASPPLTRPTPPKIPALAAAIREAEVSEDSSDADSDDTDSIIQDSDVEQDQGQPYLHSLSPGLMARWWADIYFSPNITP
ncbi:hypothetical protein DSO57_1005721 [Entomophthora muscae]|uniref:Uncharacterized protein n=1 Tax=Entomophthora muscae TaxID=34485 RepID=A0ACC2SKJ7_9FUNG|nr:hypothetical protein DSO57_1005721 [Entomophthora muscae]